LTLKEANKGGDQNLGEGLVCAVLLEDHDGDLNTAPGPGNVKDKKRRRYPE
jgi:hypothetical protein